MGIEELADPTGAVASLSYLKKAIDLTKSGMDLYKSYRDVKPTPEQEAELEKVFNDAEQARELALAEIAKAFDYQLCKCTLPPQVCLTVGGEEMSQKDISRCPKCKRVYPHGWDDYVDDSAP